MTNFIRVAVYAMGFFLSSLQGVVREEDPFIEEYCKDAVPLAHGLDVQKFGLLAVSFPGLYIELGVCAGGSINHIASCVPKQLIYGFDSFKGLPDDWDKGQGAFAPKGSWAREQLPYVLPNVRLIEGWFEETLPAFVEQMGSKTPIAFLHVDCDIYSSTLCGLNTLAPLFRDGTIIVFDEFYNYPNYKDHEFRALNEFLKSHSLQAEYIAYCVTHEQVAIRLLKPE